MARTIAPQPAPHRRSSRALRLCATSPDGGSSEEFEWRSAELDELSAMMPDPEDDIYEIDEENSEYQRLIALGMSDNSDFDDILDEYMSRMESKQGAQDEEEAPKAAEWMIEAGAREHVDGEDMEATKEQMAINNFHIRAAFKDGIIRNRTDDSILFNILNFQRAHNRFKMCKEIGRWVEFFEEHSGENYSAVMTVPSWIKAVTMVNYEFEEYNEQHRLEDRDEVDDIDYEESISLEHLTGGSGGLFKHKFEWENPPLEILGKEHLTTQDGYPKAAIDEANKLASDLLYWQGSSLHMGHYRKDMLPDYLKFQPIPDHLGNLTDEELTEELGVVMDDPHPLNERLVLTPGWHTFIPSGVPGYYQPDKHEKKPVKAMKTIQDRTDHNAAPVEEEEEDRVYVMPDEDEAPVDANIDLLWKALIPQQAEGAQETKLMGDILGKGRGEAEGDEGDTGLDVYDDDFGIDDIGLDDDTTDGLDFDLK
eukprot:jgi/Tetstr1/437317/TSEL_002801.t1